MGKRSGQVIGGALFGAAGRAAVLASAMALGACAQIGELGLGSGPELAAAKPDDGPGQPRTELEKATEYWGKEFSKNPQSGKAAISYARNLKALGRKQEALSVLQGAYVHNAADREYLSEYGRLALEQGQVSTAAQLLERADDPAKPDWRVISGRGTALAKQGQFKDAIGYFERARMLAPDQPSVMSNLAMAYAMDGQAERAEPLLRQAMENPRSDQRVKQNLALVLDLQGKKSEARQLSGPREDEDPSSAEPVAAQQAVASAAPARSTVDFGATAPVQPVSGAPLDPDAIIRAAMDAEAAKNKPAAAVTTSSTGKRKANDAGLHLRTTRKE
jgi:Flp pilus assembly protein TadD